MYYVLTRDLDVVGVMLMSPYECGFNDVVIHEIEGPIPDLNVSAWDFDNDCFIESPTKLTRVKFQNRFTLQERIAIRASVDPIVVDILSLLDAAEYVDVDDAQTQQGIQYLAMIGLIVPARIGEILA